MDGCPPVGTWSWLPRTARRGSFILTTSRRISPGSCTSFHDSFGYLSARVARAPAGARLPRGAVAMEAHAELSVPADLLRVCDHGREAARHRRWGGARGLAHS